MATDDVLCRSPSKHCGPDDAANAAASDISQFLVDGVEQSIAKPGSREQTAEELQMEAGVKQDPGRPSVSDDVDGVVAAFKQQASKGGPFYGRSSSDAAAQELSLIRALLRQKPPESSAAEDTDLLLAKKLQEEELRRGSRVVIAPKRKAASTLDHFFKRSKS